MNSRRGTRMMHFCLKMYSQEIFGNASDQRRNKRCNSTKITFRCSLIQLPKIQYCWYQLEDDKDLAYIASVLLDSYN